MFKVGQSNLLRQCNTLFYRKLCKRENGQDPGDRIICVNQMECLLFRFNFWYFRRSMIRSLVIHISTRYFFSPLLPVRIFMFLRMDNVYLPYFIQAFSFRMGTSLFSLPSSFNTLCFRIRTSKTKGDNIIDREGRNSKDYLRLNSNCISLHSERIEVSSWFASALM